MKHRFSWYGVLDKLLIAAVTAGIFLFILYPIYSVVVTSLFDKGEFTLGFYRALLTKESLRLVRNSLFVTVCSSTLTLVFSLGVALYAFTRNWKSKKRIRRFLTLSLISPPFVSSLAFIILFGRRGFITYRLLGLSINPYGWQGIVALQTIGSIAFASTLILSALEHIDYRLILASRDLGAGMGRTFWSVLVPQIMPTLLSVLFLLFTMNLSDFGTPIVIGGNYKTLATEAYLQILSSPSLGRAAAISMVMIPPAIVAFVFYHKALKLQRNTAEGSKSQHFHDEGYRFPAWIRVPAAVIFGLFVAVMALKYFNIALSAVSNTASGTVRLTTSHLEKIPKSFWSSFGNSLIYAAAAAVVSTFLGLMLSYYSRRRKIRAMTPIEFAASLPFIIPGTFFGLGYVAAFSGTPIHLSGTASIIITNLAFRQISIANQSANAAFAGIDPKIESAAKDLGASDVQCLAGILLPLLKPTIQSSFITIFTASMTAVGAIVFLISPGKNVASVELFRTIENGQYGVGAVLAVIIITATVSINLIAMRLMNKKERAQRGRRYVSGN